MATTYYIGLMSGTSVDGIDAALVNIDNKLDCIATYSAPFDAITRNEILDACTGKHTNAKQVSGLDQKLAHHYAKTVEQLLARSKLNPSDICAIGNHGQTINHAPDASPPLSLQIGNAQILADLSGIKVVSDFRSADLTVGGQGAPLAPAFHNAVFRSIEESRIVLNLGGIANISVLPKDINSHVIGFDTGPANGLMDCWAHQHLGKRFDENGNWASSGTVIQPLLNKMLADSYFKKAPPKSTGRELFNTQWLTKILQEFTDLNSRDVQATLCELSAASIASDIRHCATHCQTLILCGGGTHNNTLIKRLQDKLPEITIRNSAEYGVDPDFVEATAFAWLAHRRINNLDGNLPSVTGASKEVVLGEITHSNKPR